MEQTFISTSGADNRLSACCCCHIPTAIAQHRVLCERMEAINGTAVETISCTRLVTKITEKKNGVGDVVIIDVRPYGHYQQCHIDGSLSARLSSLLIRRMLAGKIDISDIFHENLEWKKRNENVLVVVVDDSGIVPQSRSNPSALLSFLQSKNIPCCGLEGGIQEFRAKHSEFLVSGSADRPLSKSFLPITLPNKEKAHMQRIMNSSANRMAELEQVPPTEILQHVMIGGRKDALDLATLKRLGISCVLNVTDDCPNAFPDHFTYLRLPLQDSWNQNMRSHFHKAISFILDAKKKGGKVLIHCTAGVSRSPTITMAYLMYTKKMSFTQAYEFTKSKRTIVAPNIDFVGELIEFGRKLTLETSSPGHCASPSTFNAALSPSLLRVP